MDYALKIRDLNFSFGDKPTLKCINLDIEKGDYVGIIGPNGSGKSTLIKVILGILPNVCGSVEIFDEGIEQVKKLGQIGYISQKANSFNGDFPATVFEVVGAGLNKSMSIIKKYTKKDIDRINEALGIVGMKEYKDRLIGRLSGGQQQRVFIARALAHLKIKS